MDYRDYKVSRNLAWEILIREGVVELPVMISKLCKDMGIHLGYYSPTDGNDGESFIADGRAVVLVSNLCTVERQRFTVAHELGHVLLGHTGKYRLVNREPSGSENPIEHAANVFASRLLAPACVLWALNARTAEEISTLCRISLQSAQFRAKRMELLYARGKFLSSPLERKVYEQFRPFVEREKKTKDHPVLRGADL